MEVGGVDRTQKSCSFRPCKRCEAVCACRRTCKSGRGSSWGWAAATSRVLCLSHCFSALLLPALLLRSVVAILRRVLCVSVCSAEFLVLYCGSAVSCSNQCCGSGVLWHACAYVPFGLLPQAVWVHCLLPFWACLRAHVCMDEFIYLH